MLPPPMMSFGFTGIGRSSFILGIPGGSLSHQLWKARILGRYGSQKVKLFITLLGLTDSVHQHQRKIPDQLKLLVVEGRRGLIKGPYG